MWIDPSFIYLINWFWELRSFCKEWNDPVTPSLVGDWQSLNGMMLLPWQKRAIFAMDSKFREVLSGEIARNEKRRLEKLERNSKGKRR